MYVDIAVRGEEGSFPRTPGYEANVDRAFFTIIIAINHAMECDNYYEMSDGSRSVETSFPF